MEPIPDDYLSDDYLSNIVIEIVTNDIVETFVEEEPLRLNQGNRD